MNVDEALAVADQGAEPWPSAHALYVLAAEVRRLRKAVTEMSEDLNEVMARGDL